MQETKLVRNYLKVVFIPTIDINKPSEETVPFVVDGDLINTVSVTTSITESAGTFTISLFNANKSLMENENISASIKYLNDLSTIVKSEEETAQKPSSPTEDIVVLKRQQPTSTADDILKFFTFYRTEDDFLDFKHEFIIDNTGKKYKIYYEIDENDLKRTENKNRPLDFRKSRWYIKDENGTPKVYFITVSIVDNALQYYSNEKITTTENKTKTDSSGKPIQEIDIKSHSSKSGSSNVTSQIQYVTNRQILYGGWNSGYWQKANSYSVNTEGIYPKISPMDYVFVYMSNTIGIDGNPVYTRVFTGLVNKVSFDKSNTDTITVTGEDVTKILRLSIFATDPAIFNKSDYDTYPVVEAIKPVQNALSGMTATDIVKKMIEDLGSGLAPNNSIKYNVKSITGSVPDKMIELQDKTYSEQDLTKTNILNEFTANQNLLLENPTLPGLASIEQYHPYRIMMGSKNNLVQTEFRDRLQICREVAKIIGFEFFADAYGNLHFRQPRFDLSNIFLYKNPNTYILNPEDIKSYSIAEDDTNIITSVRVTGSQDYIGTNEFALEMYAEYPNRSLNRKYGARWYETSSPLVGTDKQCMMYAKALMRKLNADRISAQVEMNLRPDLYPGNPVFLPEINRVLNICFLAL